MILFDQKKIILTNKTLIEIVIILLTPEEGRFKMDVRKKLFTVRVALKQFDQGGCG